MSTIDSSQPQEDVENRFCMNKVDYSDFKNSEEIKKFENEETYGVQIMYENKSKLKSDVSIQMQKLGYPIKVQKSEKGRIIYKCCVSDCPFMLHFQGDDVSGWIMKRYCHHDSTKCNRFNMIYIKLNKQNKIDYQIIKTMIKNRIKNHQFNISDISLNPMILSKDASNSNDQNHEDEAEIHETINFTHNSRSSDANSNPTNTQTLPILEDPFISSKNSEMVIEDINKSKDNNHEDEESRTIDIELNIEDTSIDNVFSYEEQNEGITEDRFNNIFKDISDKCIFIQYKSHKYNQDISSNDVVSYLKENNLAKYFKSISQLKQFLEKKNISVSYEIARNALRELGIKSTNDYSKIPCIIKSIISKENYAIYGCLPPGYTYKNINAYPSSSYIQSNIDENIVDNHLEQDETFRVNLEDSVLNYSENDSVCSGNNSNMNIHEEINMDRELNKAVGNNKVISHEFLYSFVSIKSNIALYKKGNKAVIFMDGTHMYMNDHIILTAISITINRQILLLAYGIYAVECLATWSDFQTNLKKALELMSCKTTNITFFSDMDKGLKGSLGVVFPECTYISCAFHILKKMTNVNSRIIGLISQLILIDDEEEFYKLINDSSITENQKKQILSQRGKNMYNIDLPPHVSRYGYIASSLAESFNNLISDIRGMSIQKVLFEIYNHAINYQLKIKEAPHISFFLPYFQKEFDMADIFVSNVISYKSINKGLYRLVMEEENREYIINFEQNTCSCSIFQYQGYPCIHAILLYKKRIDDSCLKEESHINITGPNNPIRKSGRPSKFNYSHITSYYLKNKYWKIKNSIPALECLNECAVEAEKEKYEETDIASIPTLEDVESSEYSSKRRK
ncbi:hypothetical protein WA158_002995 [Blastocystis sp. Blastoise]